MRKLLIVLVAILITGCSSQIDGVNFDSDKTIVPVCEECGLIAVHEEFKNRSYCPICGDNITISNIELSYAFKLMLDEFKSLGIYPRLMLQDKY